MLDRLAIGADHDGGIAGYLARDRLEVVQAIGQHPRGNCQCGVRAGFQRLLGKRDAVSCARTSGAHRRSSAPPRHRTPCSRSLARACLGARYPNRHRVDLHASLQDAVLFPLGHHLREFVLHQPSRLVAHPEMLPQFQSGDVVLDLGHQVHGNESVGERQLDCLEDGTGGDHGLMSAAAVLPVVPSAPNKGRMPLIATVRTAKSSRLVRDQQHCVAFLFRPVALHELGHRQSALKLHLVDRHRVSSTPGSERAESRTAPHRYYLQLLLCSTPHDWHDVHVCALAKT
jgi:hypothetical protein